jgi:ribosome-dependent ATPase
MSSGDLVVAVRNLEKKFGNFTAVNRINLSVNRGEIFGFLGPNGAGKSTTIRMLCGILKPTSGEGKVAGFDVRAESEKIKSHIGYMSQKFSLYEDLTVEENIDFYGGIYKIPSEKKQQRKEWVIQMADLQKQRHSKTGSLSVGWKQRLALGCAILHEPPILFLDEPTSGVDPLSRRRFWDLIYSMSEKGVTIFVTTHYMEEAEYCDRLAMIYRGEMTATGTPAELKTKMMKDHIIELKSREPEELIQPLQNLEGVKEVALYGGGLHLVVEDFDRIAPALRSLLQKINATDATFKRVKASLEDVFVSLIEERDRADLTGSKMANNESRTAAPPIRLPVARSGATYKLQRVLAVAQKEFIHLLRDPRSLGLGIAIPMLMLLLFGFALTLDVDRVPVMVWNQNPNSLSRDYVSRFEGSRYFEIIGYAGKYTDMERAIDERRALAALIIPYDFSAQVESGKQASVQWIVDGSDSNTAQIATGYAEAVTQIFAADVVVDSIRNVSARPVPVDFRSRIWFNADMESRNYIIPGLIAVIMMIIAGMLTSLTIAREWDTGTMEQLISTPVKVPEMILGKLIPYFCIAMFDVVIAVLMGEFLFDIPLRGSVPLLFLMTSIFLAGALGIGMLISIETKTQLLASQLAMVVTFLPTFLLSGFSFDIANMPRLLQIISYAIPARYFIKILKGIYLKGVGLNILYVEASLLSCFAVIVLTAASLKFKKKMV